MDAELIERVKKQDEEAFSEMLEKLKWIENRVFRKLKHEEAEEAIQDIKLRIWRFISKWKRNNSRENPFEAWVSTIVQNVIKDHLKKSNHLSVPFDDRIGGVSFNFDEAILKEEIVNAVSAMDIETTHKRAWELRNILGLKHKEIAALIGCSEATSRVWCFRCNKRIREKFGGD